MNIREASHDDIQQLAMHHRKMFEEIWQKMGKKLDFTRAMEIEKAHVEKLEKQIPAGECKAWMIREGDRIVASGAVSIVSLVPVAFDTNYHVAFLHSMFTEEDFRGRGCARQIIERAIQYCKEVGIHRIFLNASDAGRPLYEQMGFVSAPESMRLIIQ